MGAQFGLGIDSPAEALRREDLAPKSAQKEVAE